MKVFAIQSTLPKQQTFGRMIAGENFSEDIISEAERILAGNGKIDPKKYKKDFLECLNDAKVQPVEWALSPLAELYKRIEGEDYNSVKETRLALGIATLGVSELLKTPEAGIRKIANNIKVKKFVREVERCMLAIVRERGG